MTLDAKIEAALFWKAEPVSVSKLGEIFGAGEAEVKKALVVLEERLKGRGAVLIFKDNEVALRTAPEAADFIEKLAKGELTRDLGRAGIETLSIILYRGPLSRREIDYVRGVNSNFIMRNLLVRGLVEKIDNPKDRRSFLYRPSFDLLSFLGISRIEDLPEYAAYRKEIENFAATISSGESSGENSELLSAVLPEKSFEDGHDR